MKLGLLELGALGLSLLLVVGILLSPTRRK
jgi:hypothetical protein